MKYSRMDWMRVFFLIAAILFGVAYPAVAAPPLNVYVVNYPLKYFAERIGGDEVEVTLPVPADVDPVYWTPKIADIGAYQQADLILLNGAGYAKWVSKVSLPRAKTVDTSRRFKNQYITVKETMTHSHGAEGEHAHEGLAFTTWLNFSLAAKQAEAVRDALSRQRPQAEEYFTTQFRPLQKDLLAMDRRLKVLASGDSSTPILFSHPVYQYLAEGYGLNDKAVHWEPDQTPGPDQMAELQAILTTFAARWMVWESTPVASAEALLKEMGLHSVVFDPCGNAPAKGDFLSVMQQNVNYLERIFDQ